MSDEKKVREKNISSSLIPHPSSPSIIFHLQDPRWKSPLRPYCKTVREICASVKVPRHYTEMSVVLCDDAFMRELNLHYRGKDKPTNVLSFPGEGEALGDIILAFETIRDEARAQKKTIRAHTTHLIVHGMLHLLGFDHENDADAAKMEQKEIKILQKLGLNNPYL